MRTKLVAGAVILGICAVLFIKFFLFGLYPFPGNYLLAWYEPWKSEHVKRGTITISHKPVVDDALRHLYPLRVLASDLLRDRQWPLWNPYNGAGMPLLGLMHPGFLNPFGLFFLIFSGPTAWLLYVGFSPVVLGIGTYWYCRKIGLGIWASLGSAATLIFSGFVIVRLLYGEFIYGFAGLPFMLLTIEDIFEKKTPTKSIFFLPVIVCLIFFSGHPQMILYVLVVALSYALYRWYIEPRRSASVNKLLWLLLFGIIGIAMASVQLFPSIELFLQASISPSSSKFIIKGFLLPWSHLLTLVIPNYFGNQATYNFWGRADYVETAASVGAIPIFLALLAMVRRPEYEKILDRRMFFFITAVVSMLSTIDWIPARVFFSIPVPIIATGVPSRIFGITSFSIAILAGYGWEVWQLGRRNFSGFFHVLGIFCSFLLVTAVITVTLWIFHVSCNNAFVPACRTIALRNTVLEIGVFAIFVFLTLLASWKQWSKVRRYSPILLFLIIAAIGWYNANKFLPFSKKETFLPQNALLEKLTGLTGTSRYFSMGSAHIKANFATYFRLYDPEYFDPLYIKRYGELITWANRGALGDVISRSDVEIINEPRVSSELSVRRNRLFDILGVRYLVFHTNELPKDISGHGVAWTHPVWTILERSSSLPRAYLVPSFEVISDKKAILHRLFDSTFDPTKTVIIEKDVDSTHKRLTSMTGMATITKDTPMEVTVHVTSATAGFLVLADNYFPGWRVSIDGHPEEVMRANYTFRAVWVSEGDHIVRFFYEPASLLWGKRGTVGAIILACVLYGVYLQKKHDII